MMLAVGFALAAAVCLGQSDEEAVPDGASGRRIVTTSWKVGMEVTADGGAFHRIVGTTTVPMDWREQRVRVVKEDRPPGVSISYQTIDDVARQMVVKIPSLADGQQARAIVTLEIKRLLEKPPAEAERFRLPNAKRADRKMASFLGPSPFIECTSPQIVELAAKVGADQEKAWEKVEAIYDWVRANVKFVDNRGGQIKGVLETLRDGTGDCDEMSSLFIALCRAKAIPARTVRVPGHVYPEFYLLDESGKGRWFPCQAAGARAFGFMPDPRPVLQKGDKLLVPDPEAGGRKKTTVRYLPDTLVGLPGGGGGKLRLKPVCEQVEP